MRLVIFSSKNIFTEGIVNRLHQYDPDIECHFIDAQDPDCIHKVAEHEPSMVIIDSAEHDDADDCVLCTLLNTFSSITIIRLRIQTKDVQVITSSPKVPNSVQDLVNLLKE